MSTTPGPLSSPSHFHKFLLNGMLHSKKKSCFTQFTFPRICVWDQRFCFDVATGQSLVPVPLILRHGEY